MKSLEKIGVLEQDEDKGGRRITQSGQRDLDREFWRLMRVDYFGTFSANTYTMQVSRNRRLMTAMTKRRNRETWEDFEEETGPKSYSKSHNSSSSATESSQQDAFGPYRGSFYNTFACDHHEGEMEHNPTIVATMIERGS